MNRKHPTRRFRITLLNLSIIACAMCVHVGAAAANVRISLRETSTVSSETVLIGDIATVEAGPHSEQVKQIDITALENVGDDAVIPRSLIEVRLILAGFDANAIEFIGADSAAVTRRTSESTDQVALSVLRKELATVWQVAPEDVLVTLVRPLKQNDLELTRDNYEIRPLMARAPQLGANQIRFGAYKQGSLQKTFLASVEVRLVKELAIALQTIPAGKVITEADVELRRQPFRDRDALHATPNVIGLEAVRVLRPGDMVAPTYLRQPRTTTGKSKVVIKRRDRVRMTAVKRGLSVSIPQVEALDDGAVGDTIRVRNLQSGKIVTGRVESSQNVKIKL